MGRGSLPRCCLLLPRKHEGKLIDTIIPLNEADLWIHIIKALGDGWSSGNTAGGRYYSAGLYELEHKYVSLKKGIF